MTNLEKALWFLYFEWVQQDRIEHSEDNDICADSQHQSQDGDDCERGRLTAPFSRNYGVPFVRLAEAHWSVS